VQSTQNTPSAPHAVADVPLLQLPPVSQQPAHSGHGWASDALASTGTFASTPLSAGAGASTLMSAEACASALLSARASTAASAFVPVHRLPLHVAPPLQITPQPPQLSASLVVSTHVAPQRVGVAGGQLDSPSGTSPVRSGGVVVAGDLAGESRFCVLARIRGAGHEEGRSRQNESAVPRAMRQTHRRPPSLAREFVSVRGHPGTVPPMV
jgi:hypothetical protein